MTAVASSVFTAAQFNTFVRDNLNETAPAKAATTGGYFVTSTLNEIVERVGSRQTITTSQTTTSTSYTNLATTGPSVTVETGELALVIWGVSSSNSTANATTVTSVEVSGATSNAANDVRAIVFDPPTTSSVHQGSHAVFYDDLTAGTNTFTLKYRVGAGTGTFSSRRLIVLPY